MKFKKIILNNFRQYKGKNEIEFSTVPEKNITVVYGAITTGKTTLLQSFNWALYDTVNLQNPNQILNLEVQRDLQPGEDAEVSVEVHIENEETGEIFKFSKNQKYRYLEDKGLIVLGTFKNVSVKENDTWLTLNDYEDQINSMLPSKLSNYFFFDGERIKVIGNQQKKGSQEVGEAVKSILGLEDYNTAIEHLTGPRSVETELRNSVNNSAGQEVENLKRRIEQADDLIATLTQSKMNLEAQIDLLKSKKEEKQKLISENQSTYNKQQEKLSIQSQKDANERRRISLITEYKQYFNRYYTDFFYTGLSDKIDKIRNSGVLNIKNEAIPNMNDKSVLYLIKRGYCVCGEKIAEGDEHYNFLLEEMKKLPPKEVGNSIADFNKDINIYVNKEKSDYFKDTITKRLSDIIEITDEINKNIDQIEKLSNQLESNVDVGQLEREVRDIESKIEDYSRMIGHKNSEITTTTNRKIEDDKKLMQLVGFDEKNRIILKQIELTRKLSERLSVIYKNKEKQLISQLEEEINKYLDKIYAGERIMKIHDDYTFHLLYKDGLDDSNDSAESEGLGIVKAISFMCGLFEVAKQKVNDQAKRESLYPLVFDAPLSNVGSYERKNIMRYLPNVASQIIIFTREEKDLSDIDEETKNKISKIYKINKYSEKYSHIEEVE